MGLTQIKLLHILLLISIVVAAGSIAPGFAQQTRAQQHARLLLKSLNRNAISHATSQATSEASPPVAGYPIFIPNAVIAPGRVYIRHSQPRGATKERTKK